jgi:excisionase family DNA binding protein
MAPFQEASWLWNWGPVGTQNFPTATTLFMDSDELLSAEEVGKILKLSKSTVQRWCHGGKLPAVKMGKMYRVRKKDLDRWYEEKLLEQVAQ